MTKQNAGWPLLIAQALLLWLAAGVGAQSAESVPSGPREGVVLGLGAGVGSRGIAGHLSLWVQEGPHALGLRTGGTSEFTILGGPSEDVGDWALLYGRRLEGRRGWARAAIGPAIVRSTRSGDVEECVLFFCTHEQVDETVPGLAVQVDVVWALSRPFGLGMTAFGNLNDDMPFAGLTLGLLVGHVGH